MVKEYFALRPAREVIAQLEQMKTSWYTNLSRQGLRERWRRSYNLYYGKHFDSQFGANSSAVLRSGAKGEIAAFAINHYRNLITHKLVLTTNQKPSFDVRAESTDPEALDQARLGNQILESDYKYKHLGARMNSAAERSLVFGRGHYFQFWNPHRGRKVGWKPAMAKDGQVMMDDEGAPKPHFVYEGDIEDALPSPYDVFVDQGLEEWERRQWVDVRVFENKYDLAAMYPSQAQEIASLPGKNEIDLLKGMVFNTFEHVSDITPYYYFIHKSTPAIPQGRLIIYCNEEVILYDGPAPAPYDETLPCHRIVPGDIFGTTEGWSDAFDLQGIQEAINVLTSIGFTNTQANGVQKLWVPEGANISSTALSKGLAIIRSQQGMKPEPLQLTANPVDLYKQLEFLVKAGETVSGINSVSRGDPDHSLKSGVALAYVQAMAAQYNSAFQACWARFLEEVASFRLELYKQYASTERLVDLTGKRNSEYVTRFTADKLSRVRRVVVEVGNPLTKTLGGRLEIAQDLKDMGFVKTPQDYITFLESGQWNTMTEDMNDQLSSIHQENDFLMSGKPVMAVQGDAHLLHAQKHYALLSNPAVRMNSPMAAAVLAHIQEHINLKRSEDPIFGMISGEPPLPPMGPPPGPPGAPPPPSGPQGPGPGPQGGKPPAGDSDIAGMMQPEQGAPPIPRLPEHLQPGAQQGPIPGV